ncbi:MAG: CHASE2 domain-containing protein [Saprospiraceae bacterium]|nr:CHASE2 domain-containing protein [Saprospiraceae bacterium]
MTLLKKIYDPHSLIITVLIFLFISLFRFLFLNMHFLDPFNNGLRDYEISDIVYSQFRDPDEVEPVPEIVLINTGLPDRVALATMLQRLKKAAPKVVAVDIELDGRKDSLTDAILKAAIDDMPQIVLAGRLVRYDPSERLFDPLANCDPYFSENATMGYTNFVSEDTSTIRFFAPYEETTDSIVRAFAIEAVKKYDPEKSKKFFRRRNKVELIYYTGNQNSFARLEAAHLLDSTTFQGVLEQALLKDKIVIVGYIGTHEPGEPELDRFFTPLNKRYTGKAYPDMYGAVIHANIATMVLREKYVFEFPKWFITVFSWIFCYANVFIFYRVYNEVNATFHGITRLLQIIEVILIFFMVAFFFYYFRVKIDFNQGILAMILGYEFVMIYETLIRHRIKFLQNL